MKALTLGITLLSLSLLSFASLAADLEHGKSLHNDKCQGCHDARIYTRPNRIIHSFEDLHARVEFCDTASKAGFSPQDIDDVVGYLNATYYKFPTQ